MKRLTALLICLSLLCGCTYFNKSENKQYTATFLSLFDTVTTVIGKGSSEEEFRERIEPLRQELERYHRLFDIYEEYEGMNNLKTLNDRAAMEPIKVDSEIISLLSDCKEYYELSGHSFNPAFGSVLSIWHRERERGLENPAEARLPNAEELISAAKHINPEDIIIDEKESTVFFKDALLKLDVGAIAKGWAVEKVCRNAEEGLLISVGGNVCATGAKRDSGEPWAVGIKNPQKGEENLHTLNIEKGCVVTSGSYIRAYVVDGESYHHIIDPKTLYPAKKWLSVTVVCSDSGRADMLSTALFLKDLDEGQALLDSFNAEALWVNGEGEKFYSPNFKKLIRN